MPLIDSLEGATIFGVQTPGDPDTAAPRARTDADGKLKGEHVSLLDGLFGGGGGSNLTPPRNPDDDGQPAFGLAGDLSYTSGGAPGDVLSKDASGLPVWSPRSGLTINSFACTTTTLARVGRTYSSLAFSASYTPSTGLNKAQVADSLAHTDNVLSAPTAFAISHSYAFTAPSTTFTFTLTAGLPGVADVTRAVTLACGNDSLNAITTRIVGPMNQTQFDAFAALATKSLTNSRAHSFTFGTDDGTHAALVAFPTRYGAPTSIKDAATGFGMAWTKVGSALNFTNSDGYTETYDVWQLDVTFTSGFTAVFA